MKLLGRKQAIKFYEYLLNFQKNKIAISMDFASDELGISRKSLIYAANYLDIAGYIRRNARNALATTIYTLPHRDTIPTQADIDYAAIAYHVYKNIHKKSNYIRARKNSSLSLNILLFIIMYNEIKSGKKQLPLQNAVVSNDFIANKTFKIDNTNKGEHGDVWQSIYNDELVKIYKHARCASIYHSSNDRLIPLTMFINDEMFEVEPKGDFIEIHRVTNEDQYTDTLSRVALESIYDFIVNNIDVAKLRFILKNISLQKQVKKVNESKVIIPSVNKTKVRDLCTVSKQKELTVDDNISFGYDLYPAFVNKVLLLNDILTLEERKKVSLSLFGELNSKSSTFFKEYGLEFTQAAILGMLKAAIAGLLYGFVPYGIGTPQVRKYVDGLKHFIKSDYYYKHVAEALFNVNTRHRAMITIYDMMAKIWIFITEGKSQVSEMIMEKLNSKVTKKSMFSLTRSEKRFVDGVDKVLKRSVMYRVQVSNIFVKPEQVSLRRLISKYELASINKDTVLYHGIMQALLSYNVVNWNRISFMEMLRYIAERPMRLRINFVFTDLEQVTLKNNLIKFYSLTRLLTKNLTKAYKENWTIIFEAYDRIYDKLFNYLIGYDGDLGGAVNEVKMLVREVVMLTQGRIWHNTLVRLVKELLYYDVKFAFKVIDYMKENYSGTYLEWHGHKLIVNLISYLTNYDADARFHMDKVYEEVIRLLDDFNPEKNIRVHPDVQHLLDTRVEDDATIYNKATKVQKFGDGLPF